MNHHLLIVVLFFLFALQAHSKDACEQQFSSSESTEEKEKMVRAEADYYKKFHFRDNPVSPRKVKSMFKRHQVNKVSKIEISIQEPILIKSTGESSESLGEINKQEVLLKKITEEDLDQPAFLQTLKEMGVPTTFLGVGKDSKKESCTWSINLLKGLPYP